MAFAKPVSTTTQISLPSTVKVKVPEGKKEALLLFGKPKVGKTFAVCSLIENALATSDTKIHYICTDDGLDLTLNYYFGVKAEEIRKRITIYEPAKFKGGKEPFFSQVSDMMETIRANANPNDWLVVDIADKFWGWAQDEWVVQSAPQNAITSYMSDAAADMKKFMGMSGSQWQWIKKLDNMATFDVVENPPCNLCYVFGEKEKLPTDVEQSENKDINDMFSLVGCRPAGQGTLAYAFNTIVYITGLSVRKYFVLADRGRPLDYKEHTYEKNWYGDFNKNR